MAVFTGATKGNGGTAVAPSSTTNGASYSSTTGYTTAGTSTGTATYTIATIPTSGSIEIRLSNAYNGYIPYNGHPNQQVTISQVTCPSTSPTPTTCSPGINNARRVAIDHGRTNVSSTTMSLAIAGSGILTGLPTDAVITALSLDFWVQNYDATSGTGASSPAAATNKGSFNGTDLGAVYSTTTGKPALQDPGCSCDLTV
ncbi:hypothetical protein [Acidipropionibacterium timonense]|uniref:hypothetical protein n=1 Tax=Acidipropionibacterium timonense TaxID=2161818 RepID=UPI0010317EFC|nr:hypothetical protein [Acidipropionibacterium timonense]